jgi:hypothetical protein
MIIAHLFTREEKHKTYLMCETTATRGMTPPYATPEHMFEVEPGYDISECEERVRSRILAEHPELEFVESSRGTSARKSRPYSSDLIFRKKKQGFLSKIGLKK